MTAGAMGTGDIPEIRLSAEAKGGGVQVIFRKCGPVPNKSGCEYRGIFEKYDQCRTQRRPGTGDIRENGVSAEPVGIRRHVIFQKL